MLRGTSVAPSPPHLSLWSIPIPSTCLTSDAPSPKIPSMSLDSSPERFRALLRNRDLVLLLTAGLISQTGDWMLATGIGFQIYALTGSTLATSRLIHPRR